MIEVRYVDFNADAFASASSDDIERDELVEWLSDADSAARQAIVEFERLGRPAEELAGIWRSHKRWLLRNVFGGKCAYCEKILRDVPRDAEHWRPKRGVSGVNHHPGYFWLAYDWRNVLPSCSMCNSYDGKGTQFPVRRTHVFRVLLRPDEVAKLRFPTEALPSGDALDTWYLGSLDLDVLEEPLLLHPYVDLDLDNHLQFGARGFVRPLSEKGEWSIKVFDLNREDLRKLREDAERSVRTLLYLNFEHACSQGGYDLEEGLDIACGFVESIITDRSTFTAARRAALSRFAGEERRRFAHG